MEFQIRVLGPVELRAGERWTALGSTKERTVLAALAWDVGSAVSVDRLVDRVWDDNPPAKPRDALYAYVSRIRRALHDVAGPAAPALERRTHTYVLQADRAAVDLHRYVGLVDQAHAVARRGDGQEALHLLRQAQGLRRGEPLAGLPGTWAAGIRAAMDGKEVDAATLQAGVALRLGHYQDLAPRLASLAEAHPTNETLVELLAVALYGTGRAVEAADALHHFLSRLVREFGTAPGARLQAVQQGILSRVPVADLLPPAPGAPAEPPPAPEPDRTDNLPHDIELVGRANEIRRLSAGIHTPHGTAAVVSLEAVDGMPGVGKTSLAVHVAHQLSDGYPDGCVFLDLRGGAEAGAMPVADALTDLLHLSGVPVASIPQHVDALRSAWHTAMANRRLILVLDNVADADQVRPLLPWASPSLVILTSRRRLTEIPGVRPVTLDVMPLRDAVSMFRHRVGAERAPTAEATAQIVRLCGFLPLAIELVASRFLSRPAWSAAELVDSLTRAGSRVPQIRDGRRELARAFEVSYRPLTPLQRMVFRRLGTHLGPEVGPHAAAALSGLSVEDTDRALEGLLGCHLLQEPTPYRYRLHDLLRDYAQGLAAAEDGPEETRAAVERLVDFYLAMADLADRQVYPFRCRVEVATSLPAPAPWGTRGDPSRWLLTEGPNLLAVLAWSGAHRSARDTALLAHVLAGFLDTEGYLTTADAVLRAAVAYWRDTDDRTGYACALLDLAAVSIHRGQYDEGSAAARTALDEARAVADPEIEAEALHQLGIALWAGGQYAQAVDCHHAALVLRADGPALQQARSLNMLGTLLLVTGDPERALEVFLDTLGKFREVRDRRGEWRTLNNLGETHAKLGDLEQADTAYRQALGLARHVGSRVDCATLQMNLAGALLTAGKPDEALALYQEVLPVLRSVGDRRNEAIALHGVGRTLQAVGQFHESIGHHTAALAVAREIGAVHEEAETLRDLGIAEHRVGRLAQAGRHLQDSLAIAERIQAPAEETATLTALADLRRQQGAAEEAEALRARVRALQVKHRLPRA